MVFCQKINFSVGRSAKMRCKIPVFTSSPWSKSFTKIKIIAQLLTCKMGKKTQNTQKYLSTFFVPSLKNWHAVIPIL